MIHLFVAVDTILFFMRCMRKQEIFLDGNKREQIVKEYIYEDVGFIIEDDLVSDIFTAVR